MSTARIRMFRAVRKPPKRIFMKYLATVVLALSAVLVADIDANANDTQQNLWKTRYPDVCSELTTAANDCSLCHTTVPSLNPYGENLVGVSDATTIENVDSDGDGVPNGIEILQDCTLPGDALSVPLDEDKTWSKLKALYENTDR
jgi:hypothetical protein